ncbi:MAG TPA: cytochrome b/b6 domain-containing protein [Cellvibrio sp.]|nr:cytochrome b/b6 domain-containing protein [Cellvibrio sp.]
MTNNTEDNTENPSKSIKVWDLPVRIFHWALVVLFITAYITNSLGSDYFIYHLWSGYTLIILVSFRIVWGLVGTYHARFNHFVKNPVATAKYALSVFKKKDTHYLGHNPLGAVMVVILLVATLVQAITGLFTNDEIFNVGPLYAYISDELSLQLTSLHRQLFYWILGAIALHILAVIFHVVLKRDNIVRAMFTGKKNLPTSEDSQPQPSDDRVSIKSSKIMLAIFILAVLIAILAVVILTAPEAVTDMEY